MTEKMASDETHGSVNEIPEDNYINDENNDGNEGENCSDDLSSTGNKRPADQHQQADCGHHGSFSFVCSRPGYKVWERK